MFLKVFFTLICISVIYLCDLNIGTLLPPQFLKSYYDNFIVIAPILFTYINIPEFRLLRFERLWSMLIGKSAPDVRNDIRR